MKRLMLYISVLAAAGCNRAPETVVGPDQAIELHTQIEAETASKGVETAAVGLTDAQFLPRNAASAPTDFSSVTTPTVGNVAATTGKVTFTQNLPLYDRTDTKAWFVGYYPAGTLAAGKVSWTVDGKTDILATDNVYDAGKYTAPITGAVAGNTKLQFNHQLAQIEVVCKADASTLSIVRASWGKIKSIELIDNPTTLTYTLNGLTVAAGATKSDRALLASYTGTAFAAIDIPASDNAAVNACAMVVPVAATATESFQLRITTEGPSSATADDLVLPLSVDLDGARASMTKGKTHRVAVVFRADGKTISIDASVVAAWSVGSTESYPVSKPYVEVGGLRWATGNLVATGNNSCKIGAPSDNGLYFQFGSLVGWTGGATGNGVGATNTSLSVDKAVWPTEMGATKPTYTWQNVNADGTATLEHKYFNYAVAPWNASGSLPADIGTFDKTVAGEGATTGTLRGGRYANLGVGDPCTYYLGGTWRLPTAAEYKTLFAGVADGTAWSAVPGWNWQATPPGPAGPSSLFFPASGYRYNSNGSFYSVTTGGRYWSSSVSSATSGYNLYFTQANGVIPQNLNYRSYGFPVRCVSSVP